MLKMPRVNPRRNPDEMKWVLTDDIKSGNTVERIYHLEIGDRDTYRLEGNPVPMIEVDRKLLVVAARHEQYMGQDRYDGYIEEARDGRPYSTRPMFSTSGSSLDEVKSKLVAEVKKLQHSVKANGVYSRVSNVLKKHQLLPGLQIGEFTVMRVDGNAIIVRDDSSRDGETLYRFEGTIIDPVDLYKRLSAMRSERLKYEE